MVETHLKNNYIDWLPVKNGEALLCVSENLDNLEGMWDYIVISDAFARVPALFEGKEPYKNFFEEVKRHLKPNGQKEGSIVDREAPIHASNVMLIDPKTKKPTRIGHTVDKKGKKIRIARKSNESLD